MRKKPEGFVRLNLTYDETQELYDKLWPSEEARRKSELEELPKKRKREEYERKKLAEKQKELEEAKKTRERQRKEQEARKEADDYNAKFQAKKKEAEKTQSVPKGKYIPKANPPYVPKAQSKTRGENSQEEPQAKQNLQ